MPNVWVDQATSPLDLSFDVVLTIDGSQGPAGSYVVQYDPPEPGFGCGDECHGTCNLSNPFWFCCWKLTDNEDPVPDNLDCYCCGPRDDIFQYGVVTPLDPGDSIEMSLQPAPGAALEYNLDDDTLSLTFGGEPIFWNRSVDAVSFAHTEGAPPDTYDITVQWSIGGNLDTEALNRVPDLSAEIVVLDEQGQQLASRQHGAFSPSSTCSSAYFDCYSPFSCGWTFQANGPIEQTWCEEPGLFIWSLFPDACLCGRDLVTTLEGVPLPADGVVTIEVRAAYGAYPELPPLSMDNTLAIAVPEPCPDIDGDGFVGIAEFLAVLGGWGQCPGCPADLDGDGEVGVLDFLIVLGDWGPCIEEPAGCGNAVNSCFVPGPGPGCADPECCAAVCQTDPYCCEVEWDALCAGQALDLCGLP